MCSTIYFPEEPRQNCDKYVVHQSAESVRNRRVDAGAIVLHVFTCVYSTLLPVPTGADPQPQRTIHPREQGKTIGIGAL